MAVMRVIRHLRVEDDGWLALAGGIASEEVDEHLMGHLFEVGPGA